MKIVTIIQARMGSSRLRGKVMADLGGDTVLERVVHRVRRSQFAAEVVIATTTNAIDDIIVEECSRLSVACFRGAEFDVLDRYYRAACAYRADAVVRICSDCPMIEPEVTDTVVRSFLEQGAEYASNTVIKTYPRGLDTEVMTMDALDRTWRGAKQLYQRSHVTPYIYENPADFEIAYVTGSTDYSRYRWTLDTPEDLAFMRAVYARFQNDDRLYWRDAIALLECEPGLVELNSHVTTKALQEG